MGLKREIWSGDTNLRVIWAEVVNEIMNANEIYLNILSQIKNKLDLERTFKERNQ